MAENSRKAEQDFWLAQIQDVKMDLVRLHAQVAINTESLEGLARLNEQLATLSKDVHDYITNHDEWCAGLSKAVGGAAAVLSRFERYVGGSPDGIPNPMAAEGVWADDSRDADVR